MNKFYLFFAFILSAFAAQAQTSPNKIGILVPYYIDEPNMSAIQPLLTAAKANPNVPLRIILNQDNGAGPNKDSNYVTGTSILQAANISCCGYVYTSYGTRPLSQVYDQINLWVSWYNTEGIFIDNVSGSVDLSYYESITAYAKKLGVKYVIGNPGENVSTKEGPEMDTLIVNEDSGLPSLAQFDTWAKAGYSPSKIGMIAYDIQTLPTSFITEAAPIFGWIYITNENLPNPYDGLPSYFNQMMAFINSLNKPSLLLQPNDGIHK